VGEIITIFKPVERAGGVGRIYFWISELRRDKTSGIATNCELSGSA